MEEYTGTAQFRLKGSEERITITIYGTRNYVAYRIAHLLEMYRNDADDEIIGHANISKAQRRKLINKED